MVALLSQPPSSTRLIDRARLDAVIDPVLRAHGAELVDVEWKSEPGGWVLRLYIERRGSLEQKLSSEQAAVNLDLCAAVARDLSPALDVADLVDHRYHLEVSTPGVERPLKALRDYVRFEGKKAKLKLKVPVAGQKVVVAVLGPVNGESVRLNLSGKAHDVLFQDIVSAHLVFEFGPAPKPGKKK
jgi:ribosome maturation factor RimP